MPTYDRFTACQAKIQVKLSAVFRLDNVTDFWNK